ncbi:hypothetical protein LIER_17511 [Lithospermum erythrorhizon]|uniref:Uncharacterized protein n=1 Tax=Lithospermum erythrorhizon TaxID=34254 RepID=A0AAV3QDA6_LITER
MPMPLGVTTKIEMNESGMSDLLMTFIVVFSINLGFGSGKAVVSGVDSCFVNIIGPLSQDLVAHRRATQVRQFWTNGTWDEGQLSLVVLQSQAKLADLDYLFISVAFHYSLENVLHGLAFTTCSSESLRHVFFDNNVADEVWGFFTNLASIKHVRFTSANRALMTRFLSAMVEGHICQVVPIVVLWGLWDARNSVKHNNVPFTFCFVRDRIVRKLTQIAQATMGQSKY